MPCKYMHSHHCLTWGIIRTFERLLDKSVRVYALVHLIPLVVYKRKRKLLRKEPWKVLRKTFKSYLKSLIFMTVVTTVAQVVCCNVKNFEKTGNGGNFYAQNKREIIFIIMFLFEYILLKEKEN